MTTTATLPRAPEFMSRDIHIDHSTMESSKAAREWYARNGVTPRYWYSVDFRTVGGIGSCYGWASGDALSVAIAVAGALNAKGAKYIGRPAEVLLRCE